MNFKSKFLESLRAGKPHADLLKIVQCSQTSSFGQHEAYKALQEIWVELRLDERSDGGTLQDSLEYVMEKTWYESPADVSLS